jgi:hypothetical protein
MSDRLTAAMDRLAAESGCEQAPARIEAALLAEFDRERRRKRRSSWVCAAGAAAACLAAALVLEYASFSKHAMPAAPVPSEAREPERPFVPIPYLAPPSPYERIQVVRMQLPVAALIAAGLQIRRADPGGRVDADVVVGQDGRARAVRLVLDSNFN